MLSSLASDQILLHSSRHQLSWVDFHSVSRSSALVRYLLLYWFETHLQTGSVQLINCEYDIAMTESVSAVALRALHPNSTVSTYEFVCSSNTSQLLIDNVLDLGKRGNTSSPRVTPVGASCDRLSGWRGIVMTSHQSVTLNSRRELYWAVVFSRLFRSKGSLIFEIVNDSDRTRDFVCAVYIDHQEHSEVKLSERLHQVPCEATSRLISLDQPHLHTYALTYVYTDQSHTIACLQLSSSQAR